ncbi:glycosyltransferase family 2 protein [Kaarinaea lacus]
MNKSIAVIIPTHNRSRLLKRALQSVLAQTRSADEIVVVDDGSTDDTRQLLQTEFPQVRYVYQSQQGVSKARNTGINATSSEWIALLDSDDEWLPEKLELQMLQLQQHPRNRLCHTDEIWIRRGVRVNAMAKHQKYGGDIYDKCLPLCAISPSSTLVHRELLEEVGTFDEDLPACEDYDLWLRICCRFPVLFIDKPLIKKYGGHQDQLSQKYWGMDRFRIQALLKILNSGLLNQQQRQWTIDMLLEKCRVYILGAQKRGKTEEVSHYQNIVDSYQQHSAAVSAI